MRVDHAKRFVAMPGPNGRGWQSLGYMGAAPIVRYLTKYLTKGFRGDPTALKKKCFSGGRVVKVGTTRFSWMPAIRPGAFLYAFGREMFQELFGRVARFRDMSLVIRLGVEVTDWASVDPWWDAGTAFG